MENYVVYKHTNKQNGLVYIGITKRNPIDRWKSGNGYKNNAYFYRAIIKYGWDNFTHEILFSELTKEDACRIEVELIEKYNATNPKCGYNIYPGGSTGSSGVKMSEIARRRISDTQKERWKKMHKISRSDVIDSESVADKRCFSESHRKAISETRKRKRIAQMDLHGNVIHVWDSLTEAARSLGNVSCSNISKCCLEKKPTAYGYSWKYIMTQKGE